MAAEVIVSISVDWEGRHILDQSLDAMYHFRESFPGLPLTHYVCPAYFTRKDDPGDCVDTCIAARILSQVRTGDEVGVHVHCWNSLLEACKVSQLTDPNLFNYLGTGGDFPWYGVPRQNGRSIDSGYGIAIGAFDAASNMNIIGGARNILQRNGIGSDFRGFRAGGWMGADSVLEAVRGLGLTYDASATDSAKFGGLDVPRGTFLYQWIKRIWGSMEQKAWLANSLTLQAQKNGVTFDTEPYLITINNSTSDKLIEMPDNGILADYVDARYMYDLIEGAVVRAELSANRHLFVHIGFHQESAAVTYDTMNRTVSGQGYLTKVTEALMALKKSGLYEKVRFLTTADAAKLAFPSTAN